MSRTFAALLAPLVLLGALSILVAPAARANGILISVQPLPPDVRRRLPPPRPPLPPVRLKTHSVSAVLHDRVADVTVEQVFHNHTGRQLEGTYLFPLPEGASVSKFAMTMGGKMVQGEILERKQARRIYEDIVRRRRDPGLLEYMGRGLFRARVFPILPRQDLTIRIRYQQVLPEDGGTIEMRYPLATDRLNASPVEHVSVDVKIESSVDIKAIYSPSHKIEVTRDGERRARVTYERGPAHQDRDLLLYVSRSPDAVGFSLQSTKQIGQDGTFMAVFAPRVKVEAKDRVPKDVVYVLDRSGSMAGPKMEQAKKAIEYGVRMLHEGDRFNVLSFSTGLYPFRDHLVAATQASKEAAVAHVEAIEPAGGTNIDGALQSALHMRDGDRLFLIVFITDGKPTVEERDPEKIVAHVKAANTAHTRIFTFGVGYDLDVRLLDRVAEATNGTRDYVAPGEDLEIVTGRFFRKVDQPVLSDLHLELGAGITDVYPTRLPDLFAGGQVVVFGRYAKGGDRTLILRGRVGEREIVYEHNAHLAEKGGAVYLPRLWAHRKVAYLLDEIRLHGENKELVDEVVRLATRYAIVTPYTAGLVVEETELHGGRPGPRTGLLPGRVRLGGLVPRPPGAPGADGALPATTPAATPEAKARDSERLRRLKEAASAGGESETADKDDLAGVRQRVRSVEGKTFVQRSDGVWVDKAWDGKTEPRKVEAWSEAYFALLQKGDKVARLLALGEKLIVVLDGQAVQIVPPPTR
jgi:Ca-activated chloride channel family protein